MDTTRHEVNGPSNGGAVADYGIGHPFTGATIISAYPRAQAIDDGFLVDISAMAREAGIKFPTAITERVFSTVAFPPPCAAKAGESDTGRIWDILQMMRLKITARPLPRDQNVIWFLVLATDAHGQKVKHSLWAKCGPGDDGEPVITIMTIDED